MMFLSRFSAVLVAVCLIFTPLSAFGAIDNVDSVITANSSYGFQIGAEAAIVMEAVTGRVLFAQNENKELPIASTTKILTSLIALEQPDIDAEFKVDAKAIMVEGSSMGLQPDDIASLRALATGMLLASGNDGANAAAVRIAGSLPAFAELMNKRAAEIGMINSSFETPSGLDGEKHYSTAYDMALLAREALKNDNFRQICSQYKLRASYGNPPYDRWLTNHNKLLNYYDGAIGVKTGFTKKAGRCLVSAAERDGVTLICVTLDSPDDWSIHQSLFDKYFPEIELVDLTAGIPGIDIPVTGGTAANVRAVCADMLSLPMPSSGVDIEYKILAERFLYAPVATGQYAGEAGIYADGQKIATVTLIAQTSIPLLYEYKEEKSFTEWIAELFVKK